MEPGEIDGFLDALVAACDRTVPRLVAVRSVAGAEVPGEAVVALGAVGVHPDDGHRLALGRVLVADRVRTDGGFRLYTDADVERLLLIRRMKPLGFTLEEMAELLELVDALAAGTDNLRTQNRLEEFVARAHEQRADLTRKLARADEFIALLHSESAPGPA
jgi:MerR family transcriptional regulator, copper efflux regulator